MSYTQSNTFHKFLAVRCPDTNSSTGKGSDPRYRTPGTCRGPQAQRFYPQCTRTIVCITCVVISLSLPVSVPDGNGFPATTRVSNVRDGRSDHYLTFTISGPTVMGWVVKFRCSKPVHNLNVSHRAHPWHHVTFVPGVTSRLPLPSAPTNQPVKRTTRDV